MSHEAPVKPTVPTTKTQIRRAAISGALYFWCAGTIVGLSFGKSLSQAISNGAAAAVGGLTAWTAYHIVSRRNDGLAILGMNSFMIVKTNQVPFLLAVAISIAVMVPIACLAGLTTLGLKTGGSVPEPTDPLYDADVDPPAANIAGRFLDVWSK